MSMINHQVPHVKRIVASGDLIQAAGVNSKVTQIRDLVGLPEPHFQLFYLAPIERFLSLTQHCDFPQLEAHLHGVASALKGRRAVMLPLASDAESLNASRDVWTYAVFVGALMSRASHFISRQVLVGIDPIDANPQRWCPFDGSPPIGRYVRAMDSLPVSALANVLYFPLVFCPRCLTWLHRDAAVLNAAMTLATNPEENSPLGALILKTRPGERGNDVQGCVGGRSTRSSSCSSDNSDHVPPASVCTDEKTARQHEPQSGHPAGGSNPGVGRNEASFSGSVIQQFIKWLAEACQQQQFPDLICATTEGWALADPAVFVAFAQGHGCDASHLRERYLRRVGPLKPLASVAFHGNVRKNALLLCR